MGFTVGLRGLLRYRALASSVAKALFGWSFLGRFPLASRRGGVRSPFAAGVAGLPPTGLPFVGWAGLARRRRSSSGARSNLLMIDCISSAVGASTNANPLDSCVSWLRITLMESATRSSAVSHCLMSSAVTQAGRLPRNTVKLIQWYRYSVGWFVLARTSGRVRTLRANAMVTKCQASCK